MDSKRTRRAFLRNSAMAGVGMWGGSTVIGAPRSPNEKLNIACVGVGGKGYSDMRAVSSENIVAVCDADADRGKKGFEDNPKAGKYTDYRKMLERKDIDAVTVSTPDHNHAPASMMAIKQGKHVFCQKPLTRTVYEARMLTEAARKYKVATQMGNQGTSSSGLRQGVEIVQSGGIGKVRECHVWTNRPVWPQGFAERPKAQPTRKTMDWNSWIGPRQMRPYADAYAPFNWRGFWDFGTGALGDMACHTVNLPFWALKFEYPTSMECLYVKGLNYETYPDASTIKFEFPARSDMVACDFYWYDCAGGCNMPPREVWGGLDKLSTSGSIMVGDKGILYSGGDYGSNWKLLPEKNFEGYEPPDPSIERSPGHAREWLRACKDPSKPAMSNFDYAGLLTETILLGNIALRAGVKIEWDGPNMRPTNCDAAKSLVHYQYRDGYTL